MACTPRRAPIALVSGGLKAFVNDVAAFPDVFHALAQPRAHPQADPHAVVAAAAARILGKETALFLNEDFQNLYRVQKRLRSTFGPSAIKQILPIIKTIQTLNVVAAFLRHTNYFGRSRQVCGQHHAWHRKGGDFGGNGFRDRPLS